MNLRRIFGVAVCAAMLVLSGSAAYADIFTSPLNQGNSALGGNANYGSVQVNLTSPTTATITFTSNTAAGDMFGDSGIVGVNINATSFTISGLTGSNSLITSPSDVLTNSTWLSNEPTPGAGNEDGFGSFNASFKQFDGFDYSLTTISFTVTDTSGTWASASSVLSNNGNGFDAAAHIFVCNSVSNCTSASVTGFAAELASGGTVSGGGGPVPEPGSIFLLGTALLGLTGVFRKKLARK
jgi:hypothetical protein